MTAVILTSFPTLREQGEDIAALVGAFGEQNVVELIHEIAPGSVVVPRYRAIPFGDLLEREVVASGSVLINSFREHRNIANSGTWSHLLEGITPRAYNLSDLPNLPDGEWFVKGETNSLKNRWQDACYAASRAELIRVVGNFQRDAFVGGQQVVIKPFIHFRQLENKDGQPIFSLAGQPLWHERRVFILDGQPVSEGFYWETFRDEVREDWSALDESLFAATLAGAIQRTQHLARFMVIDLAEQLDGSWMVIELNDGSMAGMSGNDPHVLWNAVAARL